MASLDATTGGAEGAGNAASSCESALCSRSSTHNIFHDAVPIAIASCVYRSQRAHMSSSNDEITDAAGGAGRDAGAHDASTHDASAHDASDAAGVAARDATTDVPHAASATAPASAPGGAPAPALPTIASDTSLNRRQQRLRDLNRRAGAREFGKRRDGMLFAMDGGLWLHRHVWQGRPMVHLVSTNLERLLEYGEALGIPEARLQFKPLKDPRTNVRRDAWHWDLGGPVLPPLDAEIKAP